MSPKRAAEIAALPTDYAWRAIQEAAWVLDRTIEVPVTKWGQRIGDVRISRWNAGLHKGHAYFHPLLGEDLCDVASAISKLCAYHEFSVEFRWNEHRFVIKPGAFYFDILSLYYNHPPGEYTVEPRQPPQPDTHTPRERSISLGKL